MFVLPSAARNAGHALAHTPASSTSFLASGIAMPNNLIPRANRAKASPALGSPLAPRIQSNATLPPVFGAINTPDVDDDQFDLFDRAEPTILQVSTPAAFDMRNSPSTSFAQQRFEFGQADDALRASGQGPSQSSLRGSISTHTPLTMSSYDYTAASTAYRIARTHAFAGDAAVERLGLGLSGLMLDQQSTNRSAVASYSDHDNAQEQITGMPPKAVSFAQEEEREEIGEEGDGWEADTEMYSDNEEFYSGDFEMASGMEMPSTTQKHRRSHSCRDRPPTPYHAPCENDSWLSA